MQKLKRGPPWEKFQGGPFNIYRKGGEVGELVGVGVYVYFLILGVDKVRWYNIEKGGSKKKKGRGRVPVWFKFF